MNVTLTHEDILQACQEWLQRHYNVEVQTPPEIIGRVASASAPTYTLTRIAFTYGDVPKREGEAYRTSG